MYSEQSLLELDSIQCNECKRSFVPKTYIPCKDCNRSFIPKTYVKHFDKDEQPKCKIVFNKKRPVFNSAKVSR